jgi:hypothetical protein
MRQEILSPRQDPIVCQDMTHKNGLEETWGNTGEYRAMQQGLQQLVHRERVAYQTSIVRGVCCRSEEPWRVLANKNRAQS